MKNIIKLFSIGIAAFIVPVIIILMIVNIVTGGYKIPENSLTDDLVKERLSPFKSIESNPICFQIWLSFYQVCLQHLTLG